ncbi:prephenate dehydratase [Patiriisocius marinistellae]|uniref:prephenate dehydratase n=1 Tax=Patiriisocius marinistellae TaxID=2494560 RepID=A0A5J4FW19_9FLAO|nr:prephenate dehydratase [Patiriisocius marinistellae]GEQ86927.1 prephenate dehydratase [Patiriisocius marinistellae]
MKLKIAIQGIESSFHDLAVRQLFPEAEAELVPCNSFAKVTEAVKNFNADLGVIAIENTIAGTILPNYKLIDDGNFSILGETFLTIDMFLMALPGQTVHDIDEVHSHPVALQQCTTYLQRLQPHCKLIEGKDTASEAKRILDDNLKGVAAIAGKQVAEKYGLEIIASDIQAEKENKTRFVVIGRNATKEIEPNKATLNFELDHEIGSLSNILQLLATFKINLTKIQSLPIEGKPWQYSFLVEVLFDDYEVFKEVITMLKKAVLELKIVGVYKHNLHNAMSTLHKELNYAE